MRNVPKPVGAIQHRPYSASGATRAPPPPVPGMGAAETEASRAARPIAPAMPSVPEESTFPGTSAAACIDCKAVLYLTELINCQGKSCLGDPLRLLCSGCRNSYGDYECVCSSCVGEYTRRFTAEHSDDAFMSEADLASTTATVGGDGPPSSATARDTPTGWIANPWDDMTDVPMAAAVSRAPEPSATAEPKNLWSTEMADSDADAKPSEPASPWVGGAASAAVDAQEQVKADLKAKLESSLRAQMMENAQQTTFLGGTSLSSSLHVDPQHFPKPQILSPRGSGEKR